MLKIFEVMRRHDLTEQEFCECLNAVFKKEIAEEYKKLFFELKADSYRLKNDLKTLQLPFFSKVYESSGLYNSIRWAFGKERNLENIFYCFLGYLFSNKCRLDNYSWTFFDSGAEKVTQQGYRNLSYFYKQEMSFKKDDIPYQKLKEVIEFYLFHYKTKKIEPTLEALQHYQNYCGLLEKLAAYPWEETEKIEDDFKYLITFIYSFKLFVFCHLEGDFLYLKKYKNSNGQAAGVKDLIEAKKYISSFFDSNDETAEEFILRCADFFFKNEIIPAMVLNTASKPKNGSESKDDSAEYHSVDEWESFELEQDENKE